MNIAKYFNENEKVVKKIWNLGIDKLKIDAEKALKLVNNFYKVTYPDKQRTQYIRIDSIELIDNKKLLEVDYDENTRGIFVCYTIVDNNSISREIAPVNKFIVMNNGNDVLVNKIEEGEFRRAFISTYHRIANIKFNNSNDEFINTFQVIQDFYRFCESLN